MSGQPDASGENLDTKCERLHRVCTVRGCLLTHPGASRGTPSANWLLKCPLRVGRYQVSIANVSAAVSAQSDPAARGRRQGR